VAAYLRQLERSSGDESVREAFSDAQRECICRVVAVTELNTQYAGDKVQHSSTHINIREFLPFLSCIVVYIDD
jgi:hypothetical protein